MTRGLLGIAILLAAGTKDHDPSTKDIMRLGGDAWKRGDFQSAALWYERATELAPDLPETSYDMALSYYRMGLYEQSLRYLDRAQRIAHGQLLTRCLLLRADIEYRNALKEVSIRRVEGLERALRLYRDVLVASAKSASLAGIAQYDIEVVKLQLPAAREHAPKTASPTGILQDLSADDAAAETASPEKKNRITTAPEERDW